VDQEQPIDGIPTQIGAGGRIEQTLYDAYTR
jgi:hypothetical protein